MVTPGLAYKDNVVSLERETSMKKKMIVIGSAAIVMIIAAILFFSQPKQIVDTGYDIGRVTYNGNDVTEQVDCEKLASIVSKYTCSRLPHAFAPTQTSQVVVELNGSDGGKALHILLGDINVAYESANKGGYTIQNSEVLLTEILGVIR